MKTKKKKDMFKIKEKTCEIKTMEDLHNTCSICLSIISSQIFCPNVECINPNQKLKAVIPEMHNQLLSSVICGKCTQSLNVIYDFKYGCYKTEETILLKVTKIKSDLKLDLCDIMLWTDNTPKPIKNNLEGICRTCLRLYEKHGQGVDGNIFNLLKVCVPEVDINLTLNPDICEICVKTLREWDQFKMTYVYTENVTKRYCNTFSINRENIEINKLLQYAKEWKYLSQHCHFNSEMIKCSPPHEYFKIEIDDCDKTNLLMYLEEDIRKDYQTEVDDNQDIKFIIQETVEIVLKPMKRNGVYMYMCPKCKKIVKNMDTHLNEHGEYQLQFSYQCFKCDYRNRSKVKLREHLLSHKQGCPEKLFTCEQCSFQTKQKGNLMTHQLVHKKPEEIKMFKCHLCKFQARQKGNLKTHSLTHKKPEEIIMYKCNICTYQARQKGNLQTHILKKHKHFDDKILEEALFYKCNKCSYKAKQKPSLKKHMLLHES